MVLGGKEGAEVEVVKLIPNAQYLTFQPNLIDDCEVNSLKKANGEPPINQFNFACFSNVEWIKIDNHKILLTTNN